MDALLDAVRSSHNSKVGNSSVETNRTMVFTNTVDAAESVAKILQRVGVECLSYHSETSLEERAKNLTIFREIGGVLVCTDAAARGLDIPNVSHVIQVRCYYSITSGSCLLFHFVSSIKYKDAYCAGNCNSDILLVIHK